MEFYEQMVSYLPNTDKSKIEAKVDKAEVITKTEDKPQDSASANLPLLWAKWVYLVYIKENISKPQTKPVEEKAIMM